VLCAAASASVCSVFCGDEDRLLFVLELAVCFASTEQSINRAAQLVRCVVALHVAPVVALVVILVYALLQLENGVS